MEKNYKVRTNCMNMIEVSMVIDGKPKSIASERMLKKVIDADGNVVSAKLESRKECVERLVAELVCATEQLELLLTRALKNVKISRKVELDRVKSNSTDGIHSLGFIEFIVLSLFYEFYKARQKVKIGACKLHQDMI